MTKIQQPKTDDPGNSQADKIGLFPNAAGNYGQIDENGNKKVFSKTDDDVSQFADASEKFKMENDVYSDWFLPSYDEMIEIITNLYANGIGNILETDGYWTSTEEDAENAYVIGPMVDVITPKDSVMHIRPVRSFTSEKTYYITGIGPSGGYIFYIDNTDPANPVYYEAAPADVDDAAWSNIVNVLVGTDSGDGIGDGIANTALIIAQEGHISSAAKDADDYQYEFENRIRPKSSKFIRKQFIDEGKVVFKALLSQSGTDAPTAVILENTLGEVPTLTRLAVGDYRLTTIANLFDASKVYLQGGACTDDIADINSRLNSKVETVTQIRFQASVPNSGAADDLLDNTSFLIEIYP